MRLEPIGEHNFSLDEYVKVTLEAKGLENSKKIDGQNVKY